MVLSATQLIFPVGLMFELGPALPYPPEVMPQITTHRLSRSERLMQVSGVMIPPGLAMGFNGIIVCRIAGWSVEICQVLACNPEFLSRSEVWNLLCCVPWRLLWRGLTVFFSSFRLGFLHDD